MPVRVERSDRIVTVILSRPEVRNSVDPEHAEALYQAFLDFDADESAEAAVFWGEGGAFCAGADLKRLAPLSRRGWSSRKRVNQFRVDQWGPRASNSANRSSLRSKVRRSLAGWSSRFGPIAA
jgi:enoyl-CoA hydratase/carnithine racemase